MNKEVSGYGYEFLTELFGGPLDGYRGTVMSINDEDPPKVWIEKVDQKDKTKNLGARFLEKCIGCSYSDEDKVAVYKLSEFRESPICCYDYVETIEYKKYKEKYKD